MSQSELVDRGKTHTGGDPLFYLLHSLKIGVYSKLTASELQSFVNCR